MRPRIVVALAGNPNSGKTTIFNELTGARQHVGNYPGVTVERKEGFRRHGDVELQIVDLPGTYSLTAYSADEVVARDYIIRQRPDVVVDVIDATNLERNLYLAVQLMELGVPLILVLNMSDTARAQGQSVEAQGLGAAFGARVVSTVGHRGEGLTELLDTVVAVAGDGATGSGRDEKEEAADGAAVAALDYGPPIESEIGVVQGLLGANGAATDRYDKRWLAVKLLENDGDVRSAVADRELLSRVEESAARLEAKMGERPETALAGRRYEFISRVCHDTVSFGGRGRRTVSDRIDAVVTHRALGIPLFLGLMYLVFQLTFTLGSPPMDWIEAGFGWLGQAIAGLWPGGSGGALQSLLIDGVIGGVGGVVVFLPNILLLFLAIAVLEDTGYMARAAFIMDRVMSRIGLDGKSFIPLLIGFGCSVPAIMATRTIENRRARLTTMLVAPLMSCGARLPIYALIIPAFFAPALRAPMLWGIYIVGVLLAVAGARLLRSTILRGETVPFVMELPPYRVPTVKGVLIHMWERGWLYLQKAGTIILGISILLWALTSFPGLPEGRAAEFEARRAGLQSASVADEDELLAQVDSDEAEASLRHSVAGRIGTAMAPVIAPMGFDWRIGTALIGAFAAKEVFVAQMGIVYSVGEADEESAPLRDKLRANYSPLVGLCIMLFCLVSAPCMATIAVTRRESGSWGWALLQLGGLTLLAYVLTVIVYQAGTVLGIGIR